MHIVALDPSYISRDLFSVIHYKDTFVLVSVLGQVGPYSLPKRLVRRSCFVASFFSFQIIHFSLSSSGRCLCLLLLRRHPLSLSLSFSKVFLRQLFTQVAINVVRFPFFYYSQDISSLRTLCYTSLFPMLTVKKVFSILLQHHFSKLCKCF